jgi:hypothetical protein
VGEQAVIAHADAEIDRGDVKRGGDNEVGPAEKEEGGDGAEMEQRHEGGGGPDETGLGVGAAHADVGAGVRGVGGESREGTWFDVESTGGGRK